MTETREAQIINSTLPLEEKGDLRHAIRCTEQAEKRASVPWMKEACAFRLKMLRAQLARQKSE